MDITRGNRKVTAKMQVQKAVPVALLIEIDVLPRLGFVLKESESDSTI